MFLNTVNVYWGNWFCQLFILQFGYMYCNKAYKNVLDSYNFYDSLLIFEECNAYAHCIKDEHSYSGSDLCYRWVYSNHGIIIFFTTFRKKVSYYWTCCQSMWMSVVETSLAFQWRVLLTHQLYRDRNRCSYPHSTRHRWVSGWKDVVIFVLV